MRRPLGVRHMVFNLPGGASALFPSTASPSKHSTTTSRKPKPSGLFFFLSFFFIFACISRAAGHSTTSSGFRHQRHAELSRHFPSHGRWGGTAAASDSSCCFFLLFLVLVHCGDVIPQVPVPNVRPRRVLQCPKSISQSTSP